MEVEGDGVSFTISGRTRDSKLGLFCNKPDLVYRHSSPQDGLDQHQLETGQGSFP